MRFHFFLFFFFFNLQFLLKLVLFLFDYIFNLTCIPESRNPSVLVISGEEKQNT